MGDIPSFGRRRDQIMIPFMQSCQRSDSALDHVLADRFGRWIALRLTEGEREIPLEAAERLRIARVQALSHRKVAPQQTRPICQSRKFAAVFEGSGFWKWIACGAPIVALAAGLVFVQIELDDRAAQQEARLDTQLLTDVLPPAAYVDAGFREFLQPRQRHAIRQDPPNPSTSTADGNHV
jgi:hypothetical protein